MDQWSETTAADWHRRAERQAFDGQAFVNGRRHETVNRKTFTSINPATGAALVEIAAAEAVDVDHAVAAAQAAFADRRWAGQSAEARKTVLLRLAELVEAHRDELALLDSLEMGKPIGEALSVDVPGTAATLRWYAEAIDKQSDEIPSTAPGSTALVTREPLGVVAAITPWNYPLEIAAWKIAPALAMGNSMVHKPAPQASLSVLRLAELAIEAGLPAGVLNVLPGEAVVGEALGRHPEVDVLSFTGSTAVAKRLLEYSGQSNMKRLSLEAGGKTANVVFADTDDLKHAAEMAAAGAFYNLGQVCSANCRLLVERSIHNEFIASLCEASQAYAPGDPLDPNSRTGALVSRAHANKVRQAIEQGRADGRLLHGGGQPRVDGNSEPFIEPTIIGSLPSEHALLHEEVFGPLLTVEVFDSEAEAVQLANRTVYGLAASLWTGSLARAHRVAAELIAGTVSVNTVDALGVTTPFGGFKQSGFGRDLSLHALETYSALKTTWIQFG